MKASAGVDAGRRYPAGASQSWKREMPAYHELANGACQVDELTLPVDDRREIRIDILISDVEPVTLRGSVEIFW